MEIHDVKYFNQQGYSDITPFEVIKKLNEKTYLIREMKCTRDPSWTPKIIPGGFSGHCENNNDQKWIIEPNPNIKTIRIKLLKHGWSENGGGKFHPSTEPVKFHDYNF